MARTARTAPTRKRRTTRADVPLSTASAETASGDASAGLTEAAEAGAQIAREAVGASLASLEDAFDALRSLQEAQTQALSELSADVHQAMGDLASARDPWALVEVQGRLAGACWQHALQNGGRITALLLKMEAELIRRGREATLTQLERLNGGDAEATEAQADAAPAEAASRAWRDWTEGWQDEMAGWSRAWGQALDAALQRRD